jgi:lysophospholipase L1-like esterase
MKSPRTAIGALLALVVAAAGAAALAGPMKTVRPAAAAAPHAAGRALTIMPLGDSITAGWPDLRYGGYRRLLGALLRRDGYAVQFVGSERNGAVLPDPANEGHIGWTIPQLKAGIDSQHWLERYRPDIILLHIGTNDLRNGGGARAAAHLAALLDDIRARLPDARVIVAEIVPFRSGPNSLYRTYVAAVRTIAAREGVRVSVVDMRAILTRGDYADELHPNRRGYDKMARAWERAIRDLSPTSIQDPASQPATPPYRTAPRT